MFVLIPLSSAFLIALLMGLRSYGLFAFILFFVGVSIWGILQAQKLTATIAPCPPEQLID